MSRLTPLPIPAIEELMSALGGLGAQRVECALGDFTSVARGKLVHRDDFISMAGCKLPSVVMGLTVTGGEPEAIFGPMLPESYADMHLVPDLATLVPRPGRPDEATVLCEPVGAIDVNGQPFEIAQLSPRAALRSVLARLDAAGYTALVAPELELFLLSREEAKEASQHATLRAALSRPGAMVREHAVEAFSLERTEHFSAYFDELYDLCEAQRIPINGHAHEAALSQYEVNFRPGAPLAQADAVFRFKRLTRELAVRHGFVASFAPKPFFDQPGAGMHWHFSLQHKAPAQSNWPHVFASPDGQDTPQLAHFVAGLLKHTPGAMAFYAPHDMAYDRIALSNASPSHANWGHESRSLAFRIPNSAGRNRRVENRLPGGDANPYLTVAATLGLGLLGLQQAQQPGEPGCEDYKLPTDLPTALDALCADTVLCELLGQPLVDAYAAVKRHEHEERAECGDPRAEWDLRHLLELA